MVLDIWPIFGVNVGTVSIPYREHLGNLINLI
jgi:hypothetical protein